MRQKSRSRTSTRPIAPPAVRSGTPRARTPAWASCAKRPAITTAKARRSPGQPLRFALAGNQNCGKTTLFNQLTGSNEHVGNFPGVTVDRKDGVIRGHSEATVTDLPGIYSLSPYSSEEIRHPRLSSDTDPDGIINIVDASNIERNLDRRCS